MQSIIYISKLSSIVACSLFNLIIISDSLFQFTNDKTKANLSTGCTNMRLLRNINYLL